MEEVSGGGGTDGQRAREGDRRGHHGAGAGKNELHEPTRGLAERESGPRVDADRGEELGDPARIERAAADPRDARDQADLERGEWNDVGDGDGDGRDASAQGRGGLRERHRQLVLELSDPRDAREVPAALGGKQRVDPLGQARDAETRVRADRPIAAEREVRRDAQRALERTRELGPRANLPVDRPLGEREERQLFGHVRIVVLASLVQDDVLRLEEITRGHDAENRGFLALFALHLGNDVGEAVQIGVDGRVDVARADEEQDHVGRLSPQLPKDAADGRRVRIGLGLGGAFLQATRVEDGQRPAGRPVLVPTAFHGARLHVPDGRHVGSEERVHERRFARTSSAHERDGRRALLEQDAAQRGDAGAQIAGGLVGEVREQLLDALDRFGDLLTKAVAIHAGSLTHGTGGMPSTPLFVWSAPRQGKWARKRETSARAATDVSTPRSTPSIASIGKP